MYTTTINKAQHERLKQLKAKLHIPMCDIVALMSNGSYEYNPLYSKEKKSIRLHDNFDREILDYLPKPEDVPYVPTNKVECAAAMLGVKPSKKQKPQTVKQKLRIMMEKTNSIPYLYIDELVWPEEGRTSYDINNNLEIPDDFLTQELNRLKEAIIDKQFMNLPTSGNYKDYINEEFKRFTAWSSETV